MFRVNNPRNAEQDKRGNWETMPGFNTKRVNVSCDTPEEAARLETVLQTTRDRLLAQITACGSKAEVAEGAEWRRVAFRKVDGKQGTFWVATFVPGQAQMGSTDLSL